MHLSSPLWQLVGVEVKGHVALQGEEVAADALLEDRLGFEFGRLAVKHQQVPVQKPGGTGHHCLGTTWFVSFPKKSYLKIEAKQEAASTAASSRWPPTSSATSARRQRRGNRARAYRWMTRSLWY